MKRLPIGIQTFSEIINKNYVYIDKTKYIYELIQAKYIFFSRPRRFGKSLLCSTLQELFSGNRDLFKGLWIDQNTDYSWPVHPVVYLDLSTIYSNTAETLENSLISDLRDIAEFYELGEINQTTPGGMIKKIVVKLQEKFGEKVVIIIDEYDSPIIDHIDDLKKAKELQEVLRKFYTCIKGLDRYLSFVFITGITRFSKTSIFSGMNQLQDVSMIPKFAHLVGYTKDEINFYFNEHLQKITEDKKIFAKIGIEGVKNLIQIWYNGYCFCNEPQDQDGKESARLHAPFSILNFLYEANFKNYWFESGTPTFLIKVLKQKKYPIESFENLVANDQQLMTLDIKNIELSALLFQTGYMTIKAYDPKYKHYLLEMPNYEVKDSLLKCILAAMTELSSTEINIDLVNLKSALEADDLESFIDIMKKFYLKIPYTITIKNEKYYQTVFFVLLASVNLETNVEIATNIGRIDLLVQTSKALYLFEFKLDGSAKKALQQILDMKYYETHQAHGKKIKLVGVNFSSDAKNITEYLVQDLV
jgi:Protein of unknown function (DUF1703)./Predicted AAA-ATPase.